MLIAGTPWLLTVLLLFTAINMSLAFIRRLPMAGQASRSLQRSMIHSTGTDADPSPVPGPVSREYHVPVMKAECLSYLNIQPDGVYLDCTLGGGGHTEAILQAGGRVIAIDQDPDAISTSSARLQAYLQAGRLEIHQSNFRRLKEVVRGSALASTSGVPGKVHGLLMDLGISSYQVDAAARGFSFMGDGPLDMRMHKGNTSEGVLTAATIVNEWSEEDIANVFYHYGDEGRSRQFAREVVLARPLSSTDGLRQVISSMTSFKERSSTLARCFQALRIAVNDEVAALEEALLAAQEVVQPQGRMVVLSYHSLEDRRVKCLFRSGMIDEQQVSLSAAARASLPSSTPVSTPLSAHRGTKGSVPWKALFRRPQLPSEQEVAANRRSRSAKLRVAERMSEEVDEEVHRRKGKGHTGAKQTRKMELSRLRDTG